MSRHPGRCPALLAWLVSWLFAVGLVAATASCGHTRERARYDFERMRVQQRYERYGASRVFADGRTMQLPPPGTVSRESGAEAGVVGTGRRDGHAVAVTPLAPTPRLLALGAGTFAVYCGVCHGAAGYGGSLVAENMGPPRPPSLRSAAVEGMPAGALFAVIGDGVGRMPPAAWQLTVRERWAVVAYVKTLARVPLNAAAIQDSVRALAIARQDSVLRERAAQRRARARVDAGREQAREPGRDEGRL